MKISSLPFGTVDWSQVEATTHTGVEGVAHWRTHNFGNVRVRMMEYSPAYLADHWCSKGHFMLCLEGQLETELADGRRFTLGPGEPHRSSTRTGAKLYCVD
jgi:hypothetical protein